MGAVVGKTGIGGIGQDNQVVGDDAGVFQFADGVELAARQGPVAEIHIPVFLLATVPAGETGAHEEMTVVSDRHDFVEFFLPVRGMGGVVEQALLGADGLMASSNASFRT